MEVTETIITSEVDGREMNGRLMSSPVPSPGLTGASVVFGYIRSLLIFYVLVRSAQTLHNSMFSAIIRTPIHFFDVNPIGEPSRRPSHHA